MNNQNLGEETEEPELSISSVKSFLIGRKNFATDNFLKGVKLEVHSVDDLFVRDLAGEHVEKAHHEEALVDECKVLVFLSG